MLSGTPICLQSHVHVDKDAWTDIKVHCTAGIHVLLCTWVCVYECMYAVGVCVCVFAFVCVREVMISLLLMGK